MDRPLIVAEFTTNHMGNLNVLLEMVRQAKWAGADFIKMQKKNVEEFYTPEKLNSAFPSPYGHTYHDYRKIFEFNHRDFVVFDEFCREIGIKWFATGQDCDSVNFLNDFHLPFMKIASCKARDQEFLQYIDNTCNPDMGIVVSVAGAELEDIDYIVDFFEQRVVYVQQCTATYPCPPQDLYLGNIPFLKERYGDNARVGYSGHEVGWAPTLLAAYLGAEIIERHFCLSRHSFVHHIECALEPQEFKDMVDAIHTLPKMAGLKFGMKESEERFLVKGQYGTDFLPGSGSKMT